MATRLQLAQKVASEAGTVPGTGTLPTATTGQTDPYLVKIIRWVDDAWIQIQNTNASWLWMQSEFYGNLADGTQRYDYTDFNDLTSAAAITRFADWIIDRRPYQDSGVSLYETAVGVSDEGPLSFMKWDEFYKTKLRGTVNEGKPTLFTVAPDQKLVFSYTPDDTYTVRGRYRKDVQTLAADGDIPECPVRFHDVIVDVALMMLGTHDEAPAQLPLWQMRNSKNFCALERDQLPRMEFSEGPLA
jgi:hypothetical protein